MTVEKNADAPQRIGPWQKVSSRDVYQNPWIQIREDAVIRPDGNPGIYGVVKLLHWASGIVALNEKQEIVLVGQHRYPLDYYSWEIPEGGCPKSGDNIQTMAADELRQETGLTAGKWNYLGCMALSNSVTDELAHLYLARELTQGSPDPDPTEVLELKWVTLDQACQQALSGEITESISIVALLRAQDFLRQERSGKMIPDFRSIP